ncbi:MAG: hypothetical protein KF890_02185 [Nitrospira sp.]|nr:hypothetical protein [Nitrospira sp.]
MSTWPNIWGEVNLTRDCEGEDTEGAEDNLLSILRDKNIKARNAHCLFSQQIKERDFSPLLKSKFNTVCFTETPLPQISSLLRDLPGRNVKLRPYGLVFWRKGLVDRGANPAIYVNAMGGNNLRSYLLDQFNEHFQDVKTLKIFQKQESYFQELIHYYSLINVISERHDFAWEREWRILGDFKFQYEDLVAIIAAKPQQFLDRCEHILNEPAMRSIRRTPMISPNWNYEQILEEMSVLLRRNKSAA